MVHAYDLNMEVPNSDERHDLSMSLHLNSHRRRRGSSVSQPVDTPNRTRTFDALDPSAPGTTCLGVIKHERLRGRPRSSSSPPQGRLPLESTPKLLETIVPTSGIVSVSYPSPTPPGTVALIFDATGKFLLNSRPIKLREFLHDLVHECLKIGGRPESTHTVDSELGEVVTVTRRGCTSKSSVTTIELSVDSEVPNFLISMPCGPYRAWARSCY